VHREALKPHISIYPSEGFSAVSAGAKLSINRKITLYGADLSTSNTDAVRRL